jgi:hypothetical protein
VWLYLRDLQIASDLGLCTESAAVVGEVKSSLSYVRGAKARTMEQGA